jgi:DNA-binding transcriptional MerR regulator
MGTTGHPGGVGTAVGEPAEQESLLGIGAAAARAGVSERALRYYQQLGLVTPACTPGGQRRYSEEDMTRVGRIRELQTLLGLNLDEIALLLRNEDRLGEIRRTYHDERTSDQERCRLIRESIALQQSLRTAVATKRTALSQFLRDLDGRIQKAEDLLASCDGPAATEPSRS